MARRWSVYARAMDPAVSAIFLGRGLACENVFSYGSCFFLLSECIVLFIAQTSFETS